MNTISAGCLMALACVAAAAQDRPKQACDFDGFTGKSKLAEITRAGAGYAPGDTLVIYRAEGGWTCGYLTQRKGAGPAWVKTTDLREVPANPSPAPAAWIGTWMNGPDRIVIKSSDTPGQLHIEGDAEWHGNGGVVHTGELAGEAAPNGNRLHVTDGGCEADLTLIGKYLVIDDNNQCGGMNVRFWGVWKRR